MRRDVYIENDSGGLSVIAAAAAGAIIDDGRADDMRFVDGHQALLLELYGDDSLPVRIVVDEPLTPGEQAQWLARASWRIDAPDGRLLVMGGFDPDVLGWWRDEQAPDGDGRGVAVVRARPGSWRVDVYAHVGSMNGRAILDEAGEPVGAFLRRSHPGHPVPLWLAHQLEFAGDGDPGHEEDWRDVCASIAAGRLDVDTTCASVVGFLVHLTPFEGPPLPAPEYGWFDREAGRRIPDDFPLGLPAGVPDPDLEHFLDKLLGRERPAAPAPVATSMAQVIDGWGGEPLRPIDGGGVSLAAGEAYLLHWIAGLTADASPAFELRVSVPPSSPWTPPQPTPEFAVAAMGNATTAIGAPGNAIGWWLWFGARDAAATLAAVPDGTTLDLALAPPPEEDDASDDERSDPAIGRARYRGVVQQGVWQVAEASPAVDPQTLEAALAFVRDLVERACVSVRGEAERRAFDAAAAMYAPEPGALRSDGDTVRLAEPDERTLILLAGQVFRVRFGASWPCDPLDADDAW